MTRPDYRGMLTDDDVARIVEAFQAHKCTFSEEERQVIRDMATGGRIFKKGITAAESMINCAIEAAVAKLKDK